MRSVVTKVGTTRVKHQQRGPESCSGSNPEQMASSSSPFPCEQSTADHFMGMGIKKISGEAAGMGERCMKTCLQRAALSGSMGSNQR